MSRDQVLAMIAHVTDAAAGEGLTFDFDRLVVGDQPISQVAPNNRICLLCT
jgi:hypothetical protein